MTRKKKRRKNRPRKREKVQIEQEEPQHEKGKKRKTKEQTSNKQEEQNSGTLPISFEQMTEMIGRVVTARLRRLNEATRQKLLNLGVNNNNKNE